MAKVGDKSSDMYKNTGSQLYSCDLSYGHKVDFLKSNFELKAQLNMTNVDKVAYPVSMAGMDSTYENQSQSFFAQASIRPAFVENNFVKNMELAGRYSMLKNPAQAMWGVDMDQVTIGINYWLSWHSVLKFDYQVNTQKGVDNKTGFLIQWGVGF